MPREPLSSYHFATSRYLRSARGRDASPATAAKLLSLDAEHFGLDHGRPITDAELHRLRRLLERLQARPLKLVARAADAGSLRST